MHIMTSLISTTLIIYLTFSELDGSDAMPCTRAEFDILVHKHCVTIYKEQMAAINYQDECPWPNSQRYYNNLSYCVEQVGKTTACYEPSLMNEIFLDVHRTYFSHCHFLKDPDMPVLLLYFLPCVIITFLFPFFCSYITTNDMASCVYG